MKLFEFNSKDLIEIVNLFTDTVHKINKRDYNSEQLNAWAPKNIEYKKWQDRFKSTKPKVVKIDNEIVGFFEFNVKEAYIDCFYVKYNSQNMGIGKFMLREIFEISKQNSIKKISTHSSITAKEFFKKYGFREIIKNKVKREGVILNNFLMEKII